MDKLKNEYRIRVYRQKDNPVLPILNIFLVGSCGVLAILGVYIFYLRPSLSLILIFISLFLLVFFIFEALNQYFGTEYLRMKVEDNQITVSTDSKTEVFDVDKCQFKFNKDKDSWISLKYGDKDLSTWTLVKSPREEFFHFISKIQRKGFTS